MQPGSELKIEHKKVRLRYDYLLFVTLQAD